MLRRVIARLALEAAAPPPAFIPSDVGAALLAAPVIRNRRVSHSTRQDAVLTLRWECSLPSAVAASSSAGSSIRTVWQRSVPQQSVNGAVW
jgi:hypothetical protein